MRDCPSSTQCPFPTPLQLLSLVPVLLPSLYRFFPSHKCTWEFVFSDRCRRAIVISSAEYCRRPRYAAPPPLPPHRRYRPVLNMYPMKSYKKSITVSPLMAHERRTSDNGSRVLSQIRIMIYGGKKSRSLRRSQLDEPSEPLSPSLH